MGKKCTVLCQEKQGDANFQVGPQKYLIPASVFSTGMCETKTEQELCKSQNWSHIDEIIKIKL